VCATTGLADGVEHVVFESAVARQNLVDRDESDRLVQAAASGVAMRSADSVSADHSSARTRVMSALSAPRRWCRVEMHKETAV
jgi:hypothetical protein